MMQRVVSMSFRRNNMVVMARAFSTNGDEKPYVDHRTEYKITEHPHVPKRGSYKPMLKQGETYYWCSCGRSENQPWCDGSHKGTDYKPLKFKWEEEDKVRSVCGCKMNREEKGPMCDRTHRRVDFDNLDKYKPGFIRDKEWLSKYPYPDEIH